MSLKDIAPSIHQKEYRTWRLNGVAFETRLATGSIPNRTMASVVEGKTRKGRDSCIVRGFWGDIINSPYLTFGLEVADPDAKFRFFKKVNYQQVYSSADISEYNIQSTIHKLEDLKTYEHGFERLRHILGDAYDRPGGKSEDPKQTAANKANKAAEEDKK